MRLLGALCASRANVAVQEEGEGEEEGELTAIRIITSAIGAVGEAVAGVVEIAVGVGEIFDRRSLSDGDSNLLPM